MSERQRKGKWHLGIVKKIVSTSEPLWKGLRNTALSANHPLRTASLKGSRWTPVVWSRGQENLTIALLFKGMDLAIRTAFKSWLCYILAVWPWIIFFILYNLQVPNLHSEDNDSNDSTYFIELMWPLNEKMHLKVSRCLENSRQSIS